MADLQHGETFADFVTRERERINGEREKLFEQRSGLDQQIGQLDRDLSAIEAYEAARDGRLSTVTRGSGRRRTGSRGGGQQGQAPRRASKRDDLLRLIRNNNGLKRGEIIERMGLKGNKSGEMSVSNALTALVKTKQIQRQNGKYLVA